MIQPQLLVSETQRRPRAVDISLLSLPCARYELPLSPDLLWLNSVGYEPSGCHLVPTTVYVPQRIVPPCRRRSSCRDFIGSTPRQEYERNSYCILPFDHFRYCRIAFAF